MSDAKTELLPDDLTPPELLASRLIDAWCEVKGRPIPWENAVEITAIITRMPDAERQRLLALNAEDATPSAPSSSQQGEADAARYRWLRDKGEYFTYQDDRPSPWTVIGTGFVDHHPCSGADLDAAIDAASLESAKSGEVGNA